MQASSVSKGLKLTDVLTLYASGDDSRPGYGETIVVELQLFHQRNIILYNTHTEESEILRFPSPLPLSDMPHQIALP